MNFEVKFRNDEQEIFYWSRARNSRFGGGFGNGKTYVSMQRAVTMLLTFPGYRIAICRQVYKQLRSTTMQTFFKVCPKDFVLHHDEQFGVTTFINGSRVYWLHLDAMDEATAKGFEINALVIDQAEDVDEAIYLLMDARVGRWEKAEVPEHLLKQYPNWPKHPKWGYPLVHNYVDILDNPADDELHWTQRHFEGDEKKPDHFSITRKTDDDLNDARTMRSILGRSQEWLDKYYWGKPSRSKSIIHKIFPESIINPDDLTQEQFDKLINLIRTKANLYRVLDHGEAAPTCCVFAASFNKIHIFFGEYYVPGELISVHRQNIYDLSKELVGEANLDYFTNLADPDIFKKHSQKDGSFWTVAMEYGEDEEITSPPISWLPADNNELATRNRINELLRPSSLFTHPITGVSPAPGIYFLRSGERWPYGCEKAYLQTKSQKREFLGEFDGTKIYSDDRDENVEDHAYDPVRYYIAAHNGNKAVEDSKPIPRRSFAFYKHVREMKKNQLLPMA